ncbi:MAG: polysaccharide deacetylase family protein [bacterium]
MKLKVTVPHGFLAERCYIADILLKEFLGLDYDIEHSLDTKSVKISNSENTKGLSFPDLFFSMDESDWLKERSLPKEPLKTLDGSFFPGNPTLCSNSVPVIYGTDDKVSVLKESISLPIDIFGSAFFMLSRYEEVVRKDRDNHNRFPASASLAFREKFLNRPVINEYLEILWCCLKTLFPDILRKERKFKMVLSHDVDRPFKYLNMSLITLSKIVAADLIKRNSLKKASEGVKNYIAVKMGKIKKDPFYTFDFIMDLSEKAGLKSCFYFISDSSGNKINCDYSINDPEIISLMKKIHDRGHEIGLHPGYETFNDPEKLKNEFVKLKNVCAENGIIQDKWGARQHYLRFHVPETWRYMSEAGINYDSSIGFADYVGFRSGICYDYPVYDVVQREPLDITERPLIVMECTIIDSKYMNMGHSALTENTLKKLKETVKLFGGNFTILWHNHRFCIEKEADIFSKVIEE